MPPSSGNTEDPGGPSGRGKGGAMRRKGRRSKKQHVSGKTRASLVAQMVKNLPAMWETQVPSPGWEGPLDKATHSNILAWRIPWTEKPGWLQSMVL